MAGSSVYLYLPHVWHATAYRRGHSRSLRQIIFYPFRSSERNTRADKQKKKNKKWKYESYKHIRALGLVIEITYAIFVLTPLKFV